MRTGMKVAGLTALVLVALSAAAWADGSFSIGVNIPVGSRSRDHVDRGRSSRGHSSFPYDRRYLRSPGYGDSLRFGWPGISFGYTYSWGDSRESARDGRQARGSIGDLIWTLRYGSSSERKRAARELGQLPVDNVTDALIDALLHDPDKDVRKEAARSLAKLGAEEAWPALRYAARSDPSKRVRDAAEDALKKLAPEPLPWPYRQEVKPPYCCFAQNQSA